MNAFDIPRSSRPYPASRTREIALRYPASWFTLANPAAATVERRTATWLGEMGVLATEEARSCFRSLAVGGYAGWPFPFADVERLETITRFFTLWVYHDDPIAGSVEAEEARLTAAIRGDLLDDGSETPCLRGFREVAKRYRGVMTEAWLDRHTARYLEWIRAVRSEASVMLRHQAAGTLPTVDQYLKIRRATIGTLPALTFIEFLMDRELPAEVRNHPTFQAIEQIAAELVAIPNDLFGYPRDRSAVSVNAVTCMAAEKGVSIVEAMSLCADLHNRRVAELARLERSLLAQVEDRPLVEDWIRKLHQLIHGFTRWHDVAPRYSRVHRIESGSRIQLAVRYT